VISEITTGLFVVSDEYKHKVIEKFNRFVSNKTREEFNERIELKDQIK
jgi:HKD family nuclease